MTSSLPPLLTRQPFNVVAVNLPLVEDRQRQFAKTIPGSSPSILLKIFNSRRHRLLLWFITFSCLQRRKHIQRNKLTTWTSGNSATLRDTRRCLNKLRAAVWGGDSPFAGIITGNVRSLVALIMDTCPEFECIIFKITCPAPNTEVATISLGAMDLKTARLRQLYLNLMFLGCDEPSDRTEQGSI